MEAASHLEVEKFIPESREEPCTLPAWALEDGTSGVKSVNTGYLLLLTCGTLGLQGVWSLLLGSGTSYLLSIGYSRSTTALVWLAGPLSGTFFQPLFGAISDRSNTRWGKRKPFIVSGIVASVVAMLSIAFVRIWAARTYSMFAYEYVVPHTMTIVAQSLAIFWLVTLTFALQPIQVGLRTLIIDNCPAHQQSQASAWSGRFQALGAIATFLLDDLVIRRYPERSFEVLCLFTSLSLILTNLPTLILIKERHGSSEKNHPPLEAPKLLINLLRAVRRMPRNVRHICIVQFASWLGWFPFLYYNTTYIDGLDTRESHASQKQPSSSGVHAYFIFALVSFYFSIVLPWVAPKAVSSSRAGYIESKYARLRAHLRPTLARLWFCSQILFGLCMLSTLFITRTTTGTAVIAIAGISWSMTLWVPLAMMSAEITNLRELSRMGGTHGTEEHEEDQTGTIMSIYNVAISAPQILAGALCSAVFWFSGGTSEQNALGLVLGLGGLAAFVSAVMIVRLNL